MRAKGWSGRVSGNDLKGSAMAGSVNKVILVGNLGADPEVRNLPSGGKVVNLSVATSDQWRDKNTGERKERTEWHRVVIFSEGLSIVAERYLKKGDKVLFGKYSGTEIKIEGEDLLMMREEDILGVVT